MFNNVLSHIPINISKKQWIRGWLREDKALDLPQEIVQDLMLVTAKHVLWTDYTETTYGNLPPILHKLWPKLRQKMVNLSHSLHVSKEKTHRMCAPLMLNLLTVTEATILLIK
jgi:hypothetical protein